MKKALGNMALPVWKTPLEVELQRNKDDGSDDEDESKEATRLKEKQLARYEFKKAKTPALVAKSSILLDVKAWVTRQIW